MPYPSPTYRRSRKYTVSSRTSTTSISPSVAASRVVEALARSRRNAWSSSSTTSSPARILAIGRGIAPIDEPPRQKSIGSRSDPGSCK
jgi:hypothetical protein